MNWTIYRRYNQFSDVNDTLSRGSSIRLSGLLPPKNLKKKENFDPNFIEERRKQLQNFVDALVIQRPTIFADKYFTFHFTKFMAPVQIGDDRPDNFVMPFKIEPP